MTPIINPWWFYLIDVFSHIDDFLFWAIIVSTLALVAYFLITLDEFDTMTPEENKTFEKDCKKIISVVLFFSILTVAVPSEKTMYRMMLANYATGDNIQTVIDTIQDGVDYIFDKIDDTKGE